MADDEEWDLKKHFWPKERVDAWWEADWSQAGLAQKSVFMPNHQYAQYWSEPISETVTIENADFCERDFWGDDWWIQFPRNSGRFWTPFHLPLYGQSGNFLSPKHPKAPQNIRWDATKYEALVKGLALRLRAALPLNTQPDDIEEMNSFMGVYDNDTRALLDGIVWPPIKIKLFENSISASFRGALIGKFAIDRTLYDGSHIRVPQFGGALDFERSCVKDYYPHNARYGHGANFEQVRFVGGRCDFAGSVFQGATNFSSSTFDGYATFNSSRFSGLANFENAMFSRFAEFDNATFADDVTFERSKFPSNSRFNGTSFSKLAVFNGASFGNKMDFSRSTFHGPVFFRTGPIPKHRSNERSNQTENQDLPHSPTEWDDLCTIPEAFFGEAVFKAPVDFNGRRFTYNVDFSNAHFGDVAKFHGAALPQDTNFANTQFECPQPFQKEASAGLDGDSPTPPDVYERAFRTLKLAMGQHGARNEEKAFYIRELKSWLSGANARIWDKLAARFYSNLSGFGQSIGIPLIWLVVGAPLVFGFLYYLQIVSYESEFLPFRTGDTWKFVWYVWESSFNPVAGFDHESVREIRVTRNHSPIFFGLTNAIHRLTNLTLTFLVILAIRRRFQIS